MSDQHDPANLALITGMVLGTLSAHQPAEEYWTVEPVMKDGFYTDTIKLTVTHTGNKYNVIVIPEGEAPNE